MTDLKDILTTIKGASPTKLQLRISNLLSNRPSREPDGLLHPSSHLKDACPKAMYFAMLKVPGTGKKFDAKTMRRLELGTSYHHMYMSWLSDMGVSQRAKYGWEATGHGADDYGIPCKIPEFSVSGHADDVVLIDGLEYVIDIKTINKFMFNGLKDPNISHPYYVDQLHFYMEALGIQRGILLYVEVMTEAMPWGEREFIIQHDPRRLDSFKANCKIATKFVTPPTQYCGSSYWTTKREACAACAYNQLCSSPQKEAETLNPILEAANG